MQTQLLQGPAGLLSEGSSPLSEPTQQAHEDGAARKIQNCFRQFQDNSKLFFESNFLKLLTPHARKIPTTEAELSESIPLLYKRAKSSHNPDFQPKKKIGSLSGYGRCRDRIFTFILPLEGLGNLEGSYKKIFAAFKAEVGIKRISPCYYKRTFEASTQALSILKISGPSQVLAAQADNSASRNGSCSPGKEEFTIEGKLASEEGFNRLKIIRAEKLLREIAQDLSDHHTQNVFIIPPSLPIEENVSLLPWYLADLNRAVKNRLSNLNPSTTAAKLPPFKRLDAFRCLFDVLRTTYWLHSKGYVHRDIKSLNILVQWSAQKKRYIGVLGDCDFLKHLFGWDELSSTSNYVFWDPCAVCNLSTPYVDRYGLVISLFSLFQSVNWEQCKGLRNIVMSSVLMNTTHRFDYSDPCITAAVSICHESTRMMLHILKKHNINPLEPFLKIYKRNPDLSLPNEPSLIIESLQDTVEEHKNLFTHEAIVEAMQHVSGEMQKEGKTVYNEDRLVKLIEALAKK